jgi:phosphate transport system substrate-binding protein
MGLTVGCGSDGSESRNEFTRGTITVVSEPFVEPVVRETAELFSGLYPEASIEVRQAPVRGAMTALFAAQAELAVIGRELAEEEREVAREAGLAVTAHRGARDGVAIVVHRDNLVEQLAFDDLRGIFTGKITSWSTLGGKAQQIVPVIQSPEAGIYQFFADRVMAGEEISAPAVVTVDDSTVAAIVSRDPGAVGIVSLPFADRGVRALKISRLKGLPYVDLDARSVYEDSYPLTRFVNIVTREPELPLAGGFITFMCGEEGQRLVKEMGLVPATAPVTFSIRTPTVPAHGAKSGKE